MILRLTSIIKSFLLNPTSSNGSNDKSDRSLYTLKSQDLRLCFDHTLILC
jgi:hypothetical protein